MQEECEGCYNFYSLNVALRKARDSSYSSHSCSLYEFCKSKQVNPVNQAVIKSAVKKECKEICAQGVCSALILEKLNTTISTNSESWPMLSSLSAALTAAQHLAHHNSK